MAGTVVYTISLLEFIVLGLYFIDVLFVYQMPMLISCLCVRTGGQWSASG
jgi:hypothetical protein